MKQIEINSYSYISSCPVFTNVERGVCARCKKNLLGDFIKSETELISYCLF